MGADQQENPFKEALKEKYDEVRPLFRALTEVSTNNDDKWDEVDLENVPERKVSVTMWIRDLSIAICRKRMEHCLKTHLEASSRTVLEEFKDLFDKFLQHGNARPYKSELNRERAAIGLPPQGGGGKGQSRPKTAQENVAILTVVCVLMYNCCMQRLCSRRILSCDRNPLL